MRRRGGLRFLWVALLVLAALLAGGDTLYWRYATRQLAAGFNVWVAAQHAAGWTVRGTAPRLGGWPFAATLTTTDVDLSGGQLEFPGGMQWSADRLELRIDLLHPAHLTAIPGGAQLLRLGYGPAIPFTAVRMQADVPLPPDQPPHEVFLHASILRAGITRPVTIAELHARLDQAASAQDAAAPGQGAPSQAAPGDAALDFAIDAKSLSLPTGYRWALGSDIAALRLDGTLTGPLVPSPDPTARAKAWRDGGGALALRQADVQWGPLALRAHAMLGLDGQLQPAGHATAIVAGYDSTLDALAKADVLSPTAALAAKALLSLMAKPAAKGQPSEVEVPLRIQHSTLFMRDVPLLRLPVLDWPQS